MRRTVLKTAAAVGAVLALAATAAWAEETLPRRAALGVQLAPAESGAQVVMASPGLTAALAGLQAGDVITAINGAPVGSVQEAVQLAGALREGQRVTLSYRRGGATTEVQATATPRPLESYAGAEAAYGAVPFQGGLLRDILVTPATPAPGAPVVFLIQGYYCATAEGSTADHPYRALAQSLADQGIATYRVEKPGMGDSLGGPQCLQTDFDTEVAAFRAGLAHLIAAHGVAPERIVLLGHSMGGVQAPLLAAETENLRGVAVMGTAMRSWHDYMIELMRVQSFFAAGVDPAQGEELSEMMRPLLDRIFNETTPLPDIAEANPEHAGLLTGVLQWDGEGQILARDVSYWRQIADQRLAAAWRDGDAPVLTMYGEADFAAIDDRDHRLIVDIVNHYRPGTATYTFLPRTGHGFGLEGTRAEAQARNAAAGGAPPPAPFNPELGRVFGAWVLGLGD